MPSFIDCLISARDQGALLAAEAEALQKEFAEKFAQSRLKLGDAPAVAAAKAALEREKRIAAARKKQLTLIDAEIGRRLKEELQGYRTPKGEPDIAAAAIAELSDYGLSGYSSARGRYEAIHNLFHSRLADVLRTFRRTAFLGRRMNRPLADDVMLALHGDTNVPKEAQGLARALAETAELARQMRNAAGGHTPKRENWGWQHRHDAAKVRAAGIEKWKTFVKDLLKPEDMIDPFTGVAPTAADLERGLNITYQRIVSDGASDLRPKKMTRGRGALANQGAEHRYLIFQNGRAWLDYDKAYGSGDPVATWFDYLESEARDIAMMQKFGPNPQARVEWMIQVVENEVGKLQAGLPSLARKEPRFDPRWRLQALYAHLRGRAVANRILPQVMGDVRNLMTSALLGATPILAAVTDPFIDKAARKLVGLPQWKALTVLVRGMKRGTRDEAIRAGYMVDDFVTQLRDETRFAGAIDGHEWTRWIAERGVTWTGLRPMTISRRALHGKEWTGFLADHADQPFEQLPDLMKRAFAGFGIDRTDWDVMRATPIFKPQRGSKGFLRPSDVAALADGPAAPRVQKLLGITEEDAAAARLKTEQGVFLVASKYSEMISAWQERAVPQGTPNARSIVAGIEAHGSIPGELVKQVLYLKNFTLSFTTLQWQALQLEGARGGRWAQAKYIAPLAIGMTLGGALYLQLKAIIDGKDPQDMTDPRFAAHALSTGGGLGIYGDFLFADYARNGHNPFTTVAGPVASFASDTAGLVQQGLKQVVGAEDANVGRALTNYLRRYTPVVSSHWATRGAWNRIFLDELQYATDPQAHKSFRGKMGALEEETGQRFWWRPGGGPTPERPPDFGAAFGQ